MAQFPTLGGGSALCYLRATSVRLLRKPAASSRHGYCERVQARLLGFSLPADPIAHTSP